MIARTLADVLLVALLAAAFAAVGEAALRRRSRGLIAWNDAFLAGMGVCAAILFPLSLVLPHGALSAELALMAVCLLVAVARRLRSPFPREGGPRHPRDPVRLAILAAVAAVAASFTAVDLRYPFLWDGFQLWASKTQLLWVQGGLGRIWYPGDVYELRHITYPPIVPLYEALLAILRGGFDFDAFKPVFLPFYFALLVATYGAARAVVSARLAATATLLLALLPLVSTGHATGGYADMPQAAFVAGVVGAALRGRSGRGALPWLIGGLTTVKPEGTILAAAACAAVAAAGLAARGRTAPEHRRLPWGGIAVVAAFFALRIGFVRWVAATDGVYVLNAETLSAAAARIPFVARMCLVKMLSPRRWGLFWPAFFAAALVLLRRGSAAERALALVTAACAAVFAAIFLFSTWPLDVHIDQAYPRLLAQIAPAAVVAIVAGWARANAAGEPAAA